MQLTILQEEKNQIQIQLDGADHTICNLLVKALQSNDDVVAAAYNVSHPLTGIPKLLIQTKKGNPKDIFAQTCKDLLKTNADLIKQVSSL